MTLFRSKSLGEELIGHAHRVAGKTTGRYPREAWGAAREYAGQASMLASDVAGGAATQLRRHPRLGIAIGAGLGLGAIAAAYLMARRRARLHDGHDEHDPTQPHSLNGAGDPLDGSGEESVVAGETGLY